ncbi:MAG: helix-turn-helix transcriptional regulator [Erysipelotrichales bacterium]|nr:helix-turn-helix transcriptional regulator [Erysipelotrichales bacterium]
MEFCEKLQELRKNRGLTQEELAEALYVSRTAISKWESGRGYPSIDSLKEISCYFSVTIDDLLSADKLITIAEKENKSNVQNICDVLFGITDLCSCMLVILPLYPKTVNDNVYSVSLFDYAETTGLNLTIYWTIFISMMLIGVLKLLLTYFKVVKSQKNITSCSLVLSILAVIILSLTREPYAVIVVFLLLLIKGCLLFKYIRT